MNIAITPGFGDPVHEAQRTFRALLKALALPGQIQHLTGLEDAPSELGPQGAAILLTLADYETPIWLSPLANTESVRAFLGFHSGAPLTLDPGKATFVFCAYPQEIPALEILHLGDEDYPDRGATVVMRTGNFNKTYGLKGPGIQTKTDFGAEGLDEDFWTLARENHALFPRGVDFLFAGPGRIAGLPRSTRIEEN